jgi:Flp pilus assembly protein TadG
MSLRSPRFVTDDRGVIAVWFGVMLIPLLMVVGTGVDFGRALFVRSQLQSAADAAAVAGAAAYKTLDSKSSAEGVARTFATDALASLHGAMAIPTPTVAGGAVDDASGTSNVVQYPMTVSITARSKNILTTWLMNALNVGVTATAVNYVTAATVELSSFSSSAADENTLYWYIIPANGGTPNINDLHLMYTNRNGSSSSAVNAVPAGENVGFALKNVTGGLNGYGTNGYGSRQGTANYLYSHMSPPSKVAYPSRTSNCSLQVKQQTRSDIRNNRDPTPSSGCSSTTPALGNLNCSDSDNLGQKYYYFWNDMGGTGDDQDYNDAVFSLTCPSTAVNAGTSGSTGVVLTN